MKTYKLPISLLIFLCANINNLQSATLQHKKVVQLKFVFTAELDSINKDVLKLYDDFTYEFLFFQKIKSKAKIKREKGTYTLKKNKLTLNKETKADLKDHLTNFTFIENQGLSEAKKFMRSKKETELLYKLNEDPKFWLPNYHDPYFGNISNDKKLSKKIIEPKPEYNPVTSLPSYTIDVQTKSQPPLDETVLSTNFLSKDSLQQLKAVFIVGPVEEDTKEFIAEQKKNASYLKSLGVHVVELYHPNAKWKDIVIACENANILVYAGHGRVAVFCATDQIVEGDIIQRDLKLHKNAIVIFNHACESAGSSAVDTKDIGQVEAFRRVGDYAKQFIESNVAVYYANNYNDCLIPFFTSLFKRKPIKEIYNNQATEYNKIEARKKYQYDSNFEISIASKKGTNEMRTLTWYQNGKVSKIEKFRDCKTYDIAYVGKPNFNVVEFFKN